MPIIGPRQRFTAVPVLGGGVNNSIAFVQQTFGALYILVKYWGASVPAVPPGASAGRVSWDGATASANISSPGTAASGIGSGVYATSPSAIDLNLTEALGYPVYYWFNPVALVSTLVGFATPFPFPFPAFNIRLVGNAAASPGGDNTVNVDCWCVYPDRQMLEHRGNVAGNTLPFIAHPS